MALGLLPEVWSVAAPGMLQAILRAVGRLLALRSTLERFRDPVACIDKHPRFIPYAMSLRHGFGCNNVMEGDI